MAALLRITPGIGALSVNGRPLSPALHRVEDDLKEQVLERDDHTCRYCGFQSQKYQEVQYVGKTDAMKPQNYVTACTFCWQCFHLDQVERMQSGALIWLPEIEQTELNHICRAIYIARISQGAMADAARDALETLLARKEQARHRLGTDSPRILATVLQDFLETPEYRLRVKKLDGFRILPLDRRIVREGELEFNQFPQILAYWRSKDGPFGQLPPRNWAELYYRVKNTGYFAAPATSADEGDDDADQD